MLYQKSRIYFVLVPLILLLVIVTLSCDDNNMTSVEYHEIGPNEEPYDTLGVERFEAPNGLVIYFHSEGDGDVITENHRIRVRYTGRTTDGEIFDSSFRNGVDTPATLHVGGMVRGFMQGIAGVNIDGERKHAAREGSERTLIIPPELGYGGTTHRLNEDTLVFDIDIIAIDNPD